MLGWGKPSCPCDRHQKAWLEERMEWLHAEFPDNVLTGRPFVLPTDEFFPDSYSGSEQSVRQMFDRVCGYMDVSPDLCDLRLISNSNQPWMVNEGGEFISKVAGTYQEGYGRFLIRLEKSQVANPMSLVGTLAHELSHVRLLGEARIMREIFDNELLTDLTTVIFGLGLFLANHPRAWKSDFTCWPGTQIGKPEYMTRPMYGYALAHMAWLRGETQPNWAKHLHWNARPDFRQALRYLQQTEDSAFQPNLRRLARRVNRRRPHQ